MESKNENSPGYEQVIEDLPSTNVPPSESILIDSQEEMNVRLTEADIALDHNLRAINLSSNRDLQTLISSDMEEIVQDEHSEADVSQRLSKQHETAASNKPIADQDVTTIDESAKDSKSTCENDSEIVGVPTITENQASDSVRHKEPLGDTDHDSDDEFDINGTFEERTKDFLLSIPKSLRVIDGKAIVNLEDFPKLHSDPYQIEKRQTVLKETIESGNSGAVSLLNCENEIIVTNESLCVTTGFTQSYCNSESCYSPKKRTQDKSETPKESDSCDTPLQDDLSSVAIACIPIPEPENQLGDVPLIDPPVYLAIEPNVCIIIREDQRNSSSENSVVSSSRSNSSPSRLNSPRSSMESVVEYVRRRTGIPFSVWELQWASSIIKRRQQRRDIAEQFCYRNNGWIYTLISIVLTGSTVTALIIPRRNPDLNAFCFTLAGLCGICAAYTSCHTYKVFMKIRRSRFLTYL